MLFQQVLFMLPFFVVVAIALVAVCCRLMLRAVACSRVLSVLPRAPGCFCMLLLVTACCCLPLLRVSAACCFPGADFHCSFAACYSFLLLDAACHSLLQYKRIRGCPEITPLFLFFFIFFCHRGQWYTL